VVVGVFVTASLPSGHMMMQLRAEVVVREKR